MRINYKPIWLLNRSYAEGYRLYSIPLLICEGHRGILHKLIDFTFRIALCGVHLFLNGFLKSPEKLIAEKIQESDYIQLYRYTAYVSHSPYTEKGFINIDESQTN